MKMIKNVAIFAGIIASAVMAVNKETEAEIIYD